MPAMHQVPEGHVGVYWRGGFQVKMPFITQYVPIQVTLQIYVVPDIQCVTKDGVKISFKNIKKEYVHETLLNYGLHYDKTWIHDKIHHHIIQLCTSHSFQEVYINKFVQIGEEVKEALQVDCTRYAPGIEIIGVHVIKPDIPDRIRRNFEQLEEERIKVLIAVEKKVVEKEAEISKKMAISETEKNAKVSKILMEQTLWENEGFRRRKKLRIKCTYNVKGAGQMPIFIGK
ncbi:hypothetical protein K1719_017151 [Acacia pycnantha]|nr:hypothetical protein K1719_017151 [Acacia pycnantha]